ncbi:HEAT repeat domain-containing protein [Geobacter argillaceus]|uniref:HEAT repeat protein n=1 Tax=Geobacter argillaceus TaxID=345631 RepID=A0A562W8G8_9BACT|nr:HEAT repeat domain-containing protein [Geobacter argillaceus]TWJ26388.1 HEAT repeat protein [Geobacter argillaceus]
MVHGPKDTARTADPQGGADEEQRRQAVLALVQLPWAEKRAALLRALGDESWRVRKEAVEALLAVQMDVETVETLIELLDTQGNAGLRNAAVELLQGLGARSLTTLCRHLSDSRPGVRKFIVDILGGIGNADVVPYLIELLTDPDSNVRAAVAESLGIIGDPRGVGPLLTVLSSENIQVAFAALDALVRIGQPLPMATFDGLARDPLLKKGVFTSLGALCGAEAAPLLIGGMHETGKSVREAAITGLMNLRSRLSPERRPAVVDEPLRSLADTPCVEQVMLSLTAADPVVQRAVVTVLGLIGDGRAVAPLIAAYRYEHLRQSCIEALAAIGSIEAEALIGGFAGGDIETQCLIAFVCGELALGEAESMFRDGMQSPSPELRFVAAQAAGKAGLLSLAGEIVALLDDEESQVRRGALETLTRFARDAQEEMAAIVATLVAATSPTKRYYGVQLLSSCNQPERLLLLAKDPDPKVRRMAIVALAEMGAAQSVGSLVIALADEDDDVRTAVATALGRLGGEEVREPLLLMLQDHSPWVCRAAVKSLVSHGFKESFQALAALVHDSPGMVRLAALEGLGQLDWDRAVPYMIEALADPDSEMLKIVVQVLTRQGAGWIAEHGRTLFAHPDAIVRMRVAAAVANCLGIGAKRLLMDALAEEVDPAAREHLQTLVSSL